MPRAPTATASRPEMAPRRRGAAEAFPPPPFNGIPDDGFAFLRELAAAQDRAWYAANRQRWEDGLRTPLASLLAALTERLAAAKLPLRGDPARGVFRLHRDTRFAKDKRPDTVGEVTGSARGSGGVEGGLRPGGPLCRSAPSGRS